MAEKTRRTVTLSPENDEWLGETGRNASELIDHLVTEYRKNGGAKGAVLQLRIEQLRAEADNLESQAENKLDRAKKLEQRQRKVEQTESATKSEQWDIALSKLSFTSYSTVGTSIESDDELVAECAADLGMGIAEFREEAIDRWEDRHA
jgi:uncharacterized protein (DUF3084 family)